MVSVMLYPCILCVALLMYLFVLCVACLRIVCYFVVECDGSCYALFGGVQLDRSCMVFNRMCVLCLWSQ